MKNLYKSNESKVVSGIFGGLGEWMEVSPGILRVGYIVLAFITGILPAILVYWMAHVLISKKG